MRPLPPSPVRDCRPSPPRALAVLLTLAPVAAGCGGGSGSPSDGGGMQGDATNADLEFCVAENNRYRTMVTPGKLARSAELEAFALAGAQNDGMVKVAHDHFKKTGGGGIAFGENEIPGWGNPPSTDVQAMMKTGIGLMWAEGPGPFDMGHGHYDNMVDTRFTQLGCGVSIQNGQMTVTMDFK